MRNENKSSFCPRLIRAFQILIAFFFSNLKSPRWNFWSLRTYLFIQTFFFFLFTSRVFHSSPAWKHQGGWGSDIEMSRNAEKYRQNFSHKIFITKSLNEKSHSLRFNQDLIFCLLTHNNWSFSYKSLILVTSKTVFDFFHWWKNYAVKKAEFLPSPKICFSSG